jgi:putative transposase
MNNDRSIWHHAPPHVFVPEAIYFITAGTIEKQHFFGDKTRLDILQRSLFECADRFAWELHAWALMSNHYHLIAQAPNDPQTLTTMLRKLHSDSARRVNRLDGTPGRQVWFQYRDTCLTFEKSHLARLNYVIQNPVHHKLVPVAAQYPFCSAAWFEKNAPETFQRKVATFKTDRISEEDSFEPIWT